MMKAAILTVALGLVGGAAALLLSRDDVSHASTTVRADGLFTVRSANLNITITENGTLVAKESQKIVPKIRGEAKISSMVI